MWTWVERFMCEQLVVFYEQFLLILQVLVAAFRKRKLSLTENLEMDEITTDGTGESVELIKRTSGLK
jgi:hypothetical protein